jgi:hypothetical protein
MPKKSMNLSSSFVMALLLLFFGVGSATTYYTNTFKLLKRIIVCMLLFVVVNTTYGQTTVGPKDAGTGATVTGIGTVTWTNPGNIATSSTTDYANVTLNNSTSNYLKGTNYGFSIPADATILGIQVDIAKKRPSGSGNTMYDNVVSLVKNGSITGSNYAQTTTNWSYSETNTTYGSSTDLWGTTWTPVDINATNFGAVISATTNHNGTIDADVYYIQISVTYSMPSGYQIIPAGVTAIKAECWGAGGGGGGSSSSNNGGSGGGGGGYCSGIMIVTPGSSIPYTFGAGGAGAAGGSSSNGTGGDGGNSSVLGLTANGGTGGARNTGAAGSGGTATGGTTNTTGTDGTTGGNTGGAGGKGAGANGGAGGAGGSGKVGSPGSPPGGGGGGGEASSRNSYGGGDGADGQVTFTWITVSAVPTATCTGVSTGSITVTASGGDAPYSYKLTPGSTQNGNNLFTGLPAGTYTVTVTDASNRSSFTSATVTANPNNTITLSSASGTNAQTICINTAITNITYTTTGATGATFTGLPAGVTGGWAANVVTIRGTPTVAGAFSYIVTLTGGCSTVTSTGTLTVNPQSIAPTSISGTTTICTGSSTTLTAEGGMVAYYPFTTDFDDHSGNGLNLTGSGGTLTGGGLQLSSNSAYSSLPTTILNTEKYTISFDMKYTAIPNNLWCKIFGYRPNGTDRSPGIWKQPTSMTLHWRHDPGNTGLGETFIYNINQWYHIVGEKNGATFTLYVDGIQVDQGTVANPKTVGSAALEFGKQEAAYPGADVLLKEFKIYNSDLKWYTGSCGGTLVGSGPSITVNPTVNTMYYVRSEGTCNISSCASTTVVVTPSVVTPVFSMGATSTRCQGEGSVTYTATATNSTGITYTLDAASITGGNSIVSGTGVVTYAAGWSGTSVITASAAGCNGPKTATHTVTIIPVLYNNTIAAPQTILTNTAPTQLTGSTPTGGSGPGTYTYSWEKSTNLNGDPASFTAISGANLINYQPLALTQTTWYRRTVISGGCSNISASIKITVASPGITTSVSSLNGFSYTSGAGPSSEQTFNVVGMSLGNNNITITPPLNFEVSVLSGGIFYNSISTPNTITLTPTSGGIVNADIFVRMKAGISPQNYGPENITLSSTGFTSKTVSCQGTVTPRITASGGGSYCTTDTIKLKSTGSGMPTNLYWEGPNYYYSYISNPQTTPLIPFNTLSTIAPNLTPSMKGDYKVTASYMIGDNLVTNGGFENPIAPLLPFYSDYTYVPPGKNALATGGQGGGESLYTIVKLPSSVHDAFSSFGPKSGSYQMVINGASDTTNIFVWSQTVPVIPNTDYQFSYWIQSVVKDSPSILQLFVEGSPVGPKYTADGFIDHWKQFLYNFKTGPGQATAILSLMNKNPAANGNDFALDDLDCHQITTSSATTNISVITNTQPATDSIFANPGITVNSGTSVTFTAKPYNGGTDPHYQWKVNGTNVGTNSVTYTYIPKNNDNVTCTMISNSNCVTGGDFYKTVMSNTITMIVNNVANYWVGYNGTNWGQASNWSANKVPSTGDNVVFSTMDNNSVDAKNNLVLDINNRTVGSITNATTNPVVSLVVPPAKYLIVNDSIISPDNNFNRVYIQAYSDGTEQNGSLVFHNKPTDKKVYGTVEMYSKATFDTSRDPNDRYRWQYFGIPVEDIPASPTFDGSYVRSWYEPGSDMTNHWKQLTNDSIVRPFYGYEITQQAAKKIIFQGQLVNRDWTSPKPLKKTPTALAPFQGQYIFANPYTAAIDIKKIIYGIDMFNGLYLYSTGTYSDWQNGGNGNAGQYEVSTPLSAGNGGVAGQVPSMQAFLVQVNTSTANAYITIPYSAVVKNNELQRVKGMNDSTSGKIWTKIEVTGSRSYDKMWVFTDPGCTRNFDTGWDGYKMYGSPLSSQLFAKEADGEYQIDALDDMNGTLIGFQPGVDLEYTFTFTHQNSSSRYAGIYLYDEVENKTIEITESGTQYKFVADATATNQERFKIITRNIDQNSAEGNSKIKIFNSGGIFFVQNLSDENGEFRLFDMAGRAVCISKFGPNSVTEVTKISQQGIYIGKAVISSDKVSNRFIVK